MDSPEDLFAHTELERALQEQSYGLKNFEILKKTHLEATAKVTVLEGDVIVVSLTPRGYQVRKYDVLFCGIMPTCCYSFIKRP